MPKVSVIIPNYNHAQFLKQRVDSVLAQTFQDIEIIILDDCSTDNSRGIIELYRNHSKVTSIIYNQINSGSPFKQWKKGIELAQGEYIWIAESDDYAAPAFLQTVYSMAKENENVGISFCNSNWVNATGEPGESLSLYTESFFRKGSDEIMRLLRHNTIQNTSAAIVRKDVAVKSVEGIDQFHSCGDWLFYIRLLMNSNVCYTGEVLNNFRWYHANTSNNARKNGWWITEGIQILSVLQLASLNLNRKFVNRLFVFWLQKLKQSNALSVYRKIILTGILTKVYVRLIFSR